MLPSDMTLARSYAPSHALQITDRSWLPAFPYRLAAYIGAGAALIVLIVEQLL